MARNVELSKLITGLNRTFYGIETIIHLQHDRVEGRLNRTFYGIETSVVDRKMVQTHVLIVPFMELKPQQRHTGWKGRPRLNRTFYGIETPAGCGLCGRGVES